LCNVNHSRHFSQAIGCATCRCQTNHIAQREMSPQSHGDTSERSVAAANRGSSHDWRTDAEERGRSARRNPDHSFFSHRNSHVASAARDETLRTLQRCRGIAYGIANCLLQFRAIRLDHVGLRRKRRREHFAPGIKQGGAAGSMDVANQELKEIGWSPGRQASGKNTRTGSDLSYDFSAAV
jgi:hypothetical protein